MYIWSIYLQMNTNIYMKCLTITTDMVKSPINSFFTTRFDETVQSYKSVDQQNINDFFSLNTILTKISNNEYAASLDWYNDIIAMYQNAINFSQNDRIKFLAQYLLNSFKKAAYGIDFDSIQWNKEIIRLTTEINDLIEKSPVPQGIDPFTTGIVNYSTQPLHLTIQQNQWTISKINELCKNPDRLYDIFCILKQTKSDFDQTPTTISVDFDNLKPVAMNALYLYAVSFQKDNFDQINQKDVTIDFAPETPINSRKHTEKVAHNPVQNLKTQNDILKVTPSNQQKANISTPIQVKVPKKEELTQSQQIMQNQFNQLLHFQIQNKISPQNIQNLVNQLNLQQNQMNQSERLSRNVLQPSKQIQPIQSNQANKNDNQVIIAAKKEIQNQQIQSKPMNEQTQTQQIVNEQINQQIQNEPIQNQQTTNEQINQQIQNETIQNDQMNNQVQNTQQNEQILQTQLNQPKQIDITIKPTEQQNEESQNQQSQVQ